MSAVPGGGGDPFRWTTGNTRHREGCSHYFPENAHEVEGDEWDLPICSTCAGATEGTLTVPPDRAEAAALFDAADVTDMSGFTGSHGPYRLRLARAAVIEGVMPPRSNAHYSARVVERVLALDVAITDPTREALEANLAALRAVKDAYEAEYRARKQQEAAEAEAAEAEGEQVTEEAEAAGVPGVYVYSYPDTLRCPDGEGRVKLKVGGTGKDGIGRVLEQVSRTAQPQDAVVLRVFRTDPDRWLEVEGWFQKGLTETGCPQPKGRRVGDEWWWTTLRHVDWLAKQAAALGLVAEVTTSYNGPEIDA
jgi:hypothetical protein